MEMMKINMSDERKDEIRQEIRKRFNLWMEHKTFDEMTIGGSFIRFDMAIGLFGYPFQLEEWMDKESFNKFVSEDEFCSIEYKELMNEVFLIESKKLK